MIDLLDNLIQMAASGTCALYALFRALVSGKREWAVFSMGSGVFCLGVMYWQLFLYLYQKTPHYSLISDICWYSSYVFLLLLMKQLEPDSSYRSWSPAFLLIPLFTAGMAAFFIIESGDIPGNVICALLMCMLIFRSLQGFIAVSRADDPEETSKKFVYIAVILFCVIEYALWITSVFWKDSSLTNPYYLFDLLLSMDILLLGVAVRKVVDA